VYFPPNYVVPDTFPDVLIMDPELVDEVKQRLLFILIGVNGTILVFAGGLGYFLAGKTLRPIQEMLDEQNRFISDSSHELKTPLTSLKTSMEVGLRDKNLTLNDARILLTESITEVNKLQSLSDGLLDLAQYQKPDGNINFKKISLPEIVDGAIRKITPLARKKKINIETDLVRMEIEGDRYSLTDLLVILLDNAVKYSQSGKRVTVFCRKTDGTAEIKVNDNGIGIGEKDLPRIFDRFYRSDAARSKSGSGGYGLGLPIAKKITDIHGGSLTVDSKPGIGSTFTVRLPVKHMRNI
jgi:signal transduction histidine kinase